MGTAENTTEGSTPKPRQTPVSWVVFTLIVLVFAALFGLAWYLHHHYYANRVLNAAPQSATAVVAEYIQAREGGVGANQETPTSWITSVKSITTPTWYKFLEANNNIATTGVRPDFTTDYGLAHSNGYTVNSKLSNCVINQYAKASTKNSELIECGVTDTTIYKPTGAILPAVTLPASWTATGSQLPTTLQMVKQDGKWLVSADTTNAID